jgi:hypothetical protein
MLGIDMGLDFGCIGEHFAVEFILVGGGFVKRQGMLGGVYVVELCLGFVAEKAS